MHGMRYLMIISLFTLMIAPMAMGSQPQPPMSAATEECLECHATIHPGLVADWHNSRHAAITPEAAMAVKGLSNKLSAKNVPENLKATTVGCAECHTLRGDAHADTFEHNGYNIHVVVSPDDCATCHKTERDQFKHNIMAMAEKNLSANRLYADLQRSILGTPNLEQSGAVHFKPANDVTKADACYYCHGTTLRLKGMQIRDTDAGELAFPMIEGWPNQGVGRVNLDGSRGACSACHTRHQFSIEVARKPYTCKECHVGPDVPAFKVYSASKHGTVFSSMHQNWNFSKVPWTIGDDLTAPTCATCHISLTVNTDGDVINQRTHRMNDRLGWRIFGLVYAHPQPKSPDTSIIRNKSGLPLPTDLDGTPASNYLISAQDIEQRRDIMQRTCRACHDTSWINGYFKRLDNSITVSNAAIGTATRLMQSIWDKGYARGLRNKANMFDEFVERRWSDAWLLYANNIRFVSAMAGGGDYGVFEDGRYHLSKTLMDLHQWLDTQDRIRKK